MGWSCTQNASHMLELLQEACEQQTGVSNQFKAKDDVYFFEASGREHKDGAVTGSIYRFEFRATKVDSPCIKCGSFRIEASGLVSQGPKFMKQVPFRQLVIDGMATVWRKSFGEPTEEALFVQVQNWVNSCIDGCNQHIGQTYPQHAQIVGIDGTPLVSWTAPLFMVWN